MGEDGEPEAVDECIDAADDVRVGAGDVATLGEANDDARESGFEGGREAGVCLGVFRVCGDPGGCRIGGEGDYVVGEGWGYGEHGESGLCFEGEHPNAVDEGLDFFDDFVGGASDFVEVIDADFDAWEADFELGGDFVVGLFGLVVGGDASKLRWVRRQGDGVVLEISSKDLAAGLVEPIVGA